MLLKLYLTARSWIDDIGIGYGWLILLGIISKSIIAGAYWRHQITFFAIISVVAVAMAVYFYLRRKYFDQENGVPDFKVWVVSLKSGFWSFISFQVLLFIVLLVDKII